MNKKQLHLLDVKDTPIKTLDAYCTKYDCELYIHRNTASKFEGGLLLMEVTTK